jgi:hypothetical protein
VYFSVTRFDSFDVDAKGRRQTERLAVLVQSLKGVAAQPGLAAFLKNNIKPQPAWQAIVDSSYRASEARRDLGNGTATVFERRSERGGERVATIATGNATGNGDTLLNPRISPLRLWSALPGPWIATSRGGEAIEKRPRADRAADRLGGAQRGCRLSGGRSLDQIGEAPAAALDQRRNAHQAIVAPQEMRADA